VKSLIPFLWRWPLSALLSWALAWLLLMGLLQVGLPPPVALGLAVGLCALLAWLQPQRWRRLIVALGFALSLLMTGALPGLPAWAWLLPLLLLALLYPRSSWHDAPWFPTPSAALDGLAEIAPLSPGARVLDAGCGLGHGLMALRRVYPQARLHGIEFSGPLARLAAWRCPWAQVQRGDMWAQRWGGLDLLYVFQRPETMARAWAKACQEMHAKAWFVSLDFEVPGERPLAVLELKLGHRVLIYRLASSCQD
jgi:hypothetical protein